MSKKISYWLQIQEEFKLNFEHSLANIFMLQIYASLIIHHLQ